MKEVALLQVWSRSGMLRSALAQQSIAERDQDYLTLATGNVGLIQGTHQKLSEVVNQLVALRSHAIYSVVWSPDCLDLSRCTVLLLCCRTVLH